MDNNGDNGDEPQKYPCRGCGKVYKHQPSRSKHENKCELAKAVRVRVRKIFVCPNEWCSKHFQKAFNCNRHFNKCRKRNKKVHACTICGKKFGKLSKLKRHEPIHTKESFTCGKCFVTYNSEKGFESHKEKLCVQP